MHDLPGRFFLTMRTVLRLAALFIALITLVLWLFGGANTGRTKMTETVKVSDSVTGQEIISNETRFLPGLDFVAAGLIGAGIAWILSFAARKP